MFRIPTVKTLCRIPGVNPHIASQVRRSMESNARMYPNEPHTAWLKAFDILTDHGIGHGGDVIPRGRNDRSPRIIYLNMGDTYTPTLLFLRYRDRDVITVGAWGDIVERGRYD